MKFGPCDVADVAGTILAHSVLAGTRRIRKGTKLTDADISDLKSAGIEQVTVAVLSSDDVHEDAAAQQLAEALSSGAADKYLRLSAPFTGRVNIYAECDGLFRVDAEAVAKFNSIDPSITVATLADLSRVQERSLLATVKIIPFAASGDNLRQASAAASDALAVIPFDLTKATLLLTRTPGMEKKLLEKGRDAIGHRMQLLGCDLHEPIIVPHNISDLAAALEAAETDLVLILTASATSDENDVGPAALLAVGGRLTRFGMPVDPGNLLFLGNLGKKTVVGLPGCARSPALNGADWVLERLACGIDVTSRAIADMGVGGLLKEIPTRPQPRGGTTQPTTRANIEIILLAAGASSRMRGADKLLEIIDGEPMLRRSVKVALGSQADRVIVVIPPDHSQRKGALDGFAVQTITSPEWQEGMAASIRAGLSAISQECDAVIIALADMPDITADHLNRLVAAFDPRARREICRAVTEDGTPGHPVLFGRRFFETLSALTGDKGARDIAKDAPEYLIDVPTNGNGALVDLDTPEDWAEWRKK